MVVSTNDVLGWCGVSIARRPTVINDMMPPPHGLANLSDETEADIKDACEAYNKRRNQVFTLTRNTTKKIVSLMYWVQDRVCLDEEPNFPDGTTRDKFNQQIKEASERAKLHQEQKKIGKSLIGTEFTVPLQTRHQWECWLIKLRTTLGAIIGAKGIPLTYVISGNDDPNLMGHTTWEEKTIAGATLDGREYARDKATVHQVIIRNITKDSDTFTYIKPILRHEDGRRDMKALMMIMTIE